MKNIFLVLLLLGVLDINAQESRKAIHGKVQFQSVGIESVHVVNQTSRRGTISNANGDFKIMVKENDTLKFSDVQFKTRKIIISKNILQKGELNVVLLKRVNELDEIVVVEHKNMAKGLGLPNAGKEPLNKLERNLNAYSQASLPIVILATLLGQQGGIDDIYNIVSGNRKRDRKLKKLIDADKDHVLRLENIQIIREHFTDDFFIETIRISEDQIENFIDFCIPLGIEELYKKQRYLEVVDIFIQNKENYLTSISKPN